MFNYASTMFVMFALFVFDNRGQFIISQQLRPRSVEPPSKIGIQMSKFHLDKDR